MSLGPIGIGGGELPSLGFGSEPLAPTESVKSRRSALARQMSQAGQPQKITHPLQAAAQGVQALVAALQDRQLAEQEAAQARAAAAIGGAFPTGGGGGAGAGAMPIGAPSARSVPTFASSSAPSAGYTGPLASTDRDQDIAIRTVLAEAGNQGTTGMQAVAGVLRNRAQAAGTSLAAEALKPSQFEPWNPGSRNDPRRFSVDSPEYQRAAAAVLPVLSGEAPDPTGGATHFYAPRAQAALGRRAPSWDNGTGYDIGDHRFFKLNYGGGGKHGIGRRADAGDAMGEAPVDGRAALTAALAGGDGPSDGRIRVASSDPNMGFAQLAARTAGKPLAAGPIAIPGTDTPEGAGIAKQVLASPDARQTLIGALTGGGTAPAQPAQAPAGPREPTAPVRSPLLQNALEQAATAQDGRMAPAEAQGPPMPPPGLDGADAPAPGPMASPAASPAPVPAPPIEVQGPQEAQGPPMPPPAAAIAPAAPAGPAVPALNAPVTTSGDAPGLVPGARVNPPLSPVRPADLPGPGMAETAAPGNAPVSAPGPAAAPARASLPTLPTAPAGPVFRGNADDDGARAFSLDPANRGGRAGLVDLLSGVMGGSRGPAGGGLGPIAAGASRAAPPAAFTGNLPANPGPGSAAASAPAAGAGPDRVLAQYDRQIDEARRGGNAAVVQDLQGMRDRYVSEHPTPAAAPGSAAAQPATASQAAVAAAPVSERIAWAKQVLNAAATNPLVASLHGPMAREILMKEAGPKYSDPFMDQGTRYQRAPDGQLHRIERDKPTQIDAGDTVILMDGTKELGRIPKVKGADFGVIGTDAYGNSTYGYRNYSDQTVTPMQGQGAGAGPLTDAQGKPIPPGVDPKVVREAQSKAYASDTVPVDSAKVAELRKEVLGLPSYKNYAQAMPVYQSMFRTAGTDSKASDLNLIYGLGKIMDPGSVVREGEMVMANDTQGVAQRLNGMINSINGGARLTPEARGALMAEAHGRMRSYEDAFNVDSQHYRGIATRGRMLVDDVVPSFEASKAWEAPQKAEKAAKPAPTPGADGWTDMGEGVRIRRK